MHNKTRNPTGWGFIEDAMSPAERKALIPMAGALFGGQLPEAVAAPTAAYISLPPSRLAIPESLAHVLSDDHDARVLHARGRSYPDLVALRRTALTEAPDVVATPDNEQALLDILDWCARSKAAVIPFGGGSSVVGGVNAEGMGAFDGVVTLSLQAMDQIHDIDQRAATVHAGAGILGPALESAVKAQGLAVRHFPQSYFHSSLGGWVATRGAGHFSTQHAKIEDRVQALRVVLPDGRIAETQRLPAGSVGVDPNRLWCGSEGALGVITSVWLRCVREPQHRVGSGVAFDDFPSALEAARMLLQSGIYPTQLRILDPYEHMISRLMAGRSAKGALMVLAFESAGAPVDGLLQAAQDIAAEHGGRVQQGGDSDGTGDWKNTFFRQPYLRDAMLDHAGVVDTFETAVLWSQLPDAYHGIRQRVLDALQRECGGGAVTCRVTHAYSDGCCLYFGFFAPGRRDALATQWQAIRDAAAEAVTAFGGTASHHHAMGRMHRGYARDELPESFIDALHGARSRLDPEGRMNPGLLPEPMRATMPAPTGSSA
ncbi:MAG: FAD-binding oxidoreductase [Algiphilus sp.]|uniref:FAD-binding oxidoreductase n=1 Tax=Algiphilus sp. TaxID=1872431 RepID=UPI0032EBB0B9